MAHNNQDQSRKLEVLESKTEEEIQLAYPIMCQLRQQLSPNEFLQRVNLAQKTGYRLFYALLQSRVVGAVGLRLIDDLCWGHHIYVDDLIVDKSLRSQGIGTALMKYVQELAVTEQCQYIRLASGIKRIEAHNFYERLGYRKTSFSFALKLDR